MVPFEHFKSYMRYCFGKRFKVTVPEEEVSAFETKYDITLPTEYRDFFLHIGNTEQSDVLRLLPFGTEGHERYKGIFSLLSKPFLPTTIWNPYLHDKLPDDISSLQGALPFFQYGKECHFLVVTGSERGKVWVDAQLKEDVIKPFKGENGEHLSFFEWFYWWGQWDADD